LTPRERGRKFVVSQKLFSPSAKTLENSCTTMLLIGGFLGAGKTTLIGSLVKHLQGLGLRCAVVSNDQAGGLVDSASARLSGAAQVAEVSGACFCCKLEELVGIVEKLTANERPDVILAEPVGSCTDIMATVVVPLEKVYQAKVRMAPYVVLMDSRRALAAYGGKAGARVRKKDFSRDVGYIFRKQVEEAQLIFVNKTELISTTEREAIEDGLLTAWPNKQVIFGSARESDGMHQLLDACAAPMAAEPFMDVDYPLYAQGEALMGWYNAELQLGARNSFRANDENQEDKRTKVRAPWNEWLEALAQRMAVALAKTGMEVAHFKMSLEGANDDAAIINQVWSQEAPALSRHMKHQHERVKCLINIRAEGVATQLRDIARHHVNQWCAETVTQATWHAEHFFQPGEPKPTCRMSSK
jgi:G3E family GTPase